MACESCSIALGSAIRWKEGPDVGSCGSIRSFLSWKGVGDVGCTEFLIEQRTGYKRDTQTPRHPSAYMQGNCVAPFNAHNVSLGVVRPEGCRGGGLSIRGNFRVSYPESIRNPQML